MALGSPPTSIGRKAADPSRSSSNARPMTNLRRAGPSAPPRLAAQFIDCGGFSNAYRSGIRHGGAFDLKQATWAYRNALADARDPAVKTALAGQDIAAWIARLPGQPWSRGDSPLAAAPEYEEYLFEQWEHGNFDAFWRQPGIYAEGSYDSYPAVPIVHLSGW